MAEHWSGTWGGTAAQAAGSAAAGPDLPAEVVRLLDGRDSEHFARFGHLPGADPSCTLPHRSAAMAGAAVSVMAGRTAAYLAGSSAEVAARLRAIDPLAPITVSPEPVASARVGVLVGGRPAPGADPALSAQLQRAVIRDAARVTAAGFAAAGAAGDLDGTVAP